MNKPTELLRAEEKLERAAVKAAETLMQILLTNPRGERAIW